VRGWRRGRQEKEKHTLKRDPTMVVVTAQHALHTYLQTCVYKLLDNRSHKLIPSPLKPCKRPFLFLVLERRELWASISLQPCAKSMNKPRCCRAQVPLTCSIQLSHLQRGPVCSVRITHNSTSFFLPGNNRT